MFPIIDDDRMWDSESAYDVPPDKICALCLGDREEWLCFYPLGEIINRHNSQFDLCLSCRKWADQVYPQLYKWPRTDDRREWFMGLFCEMGEPLAFVTFSNKVRQVFLHGRLVVSLPEGFLSQSSLS